MFVYSITKSGCQRNSVTVAADTNLVNAVRMMPIKRNPYLLQHKIVLLQLLKASNFWYSTPFHFQTKEDYRR
jgi:hypothetical protein